MSAQLLAVHVLRCLALSLVWAALMFTSACSTDKPDLRYRDSMLIPPLEVPAGLDSPQYTQTMEIPAPGSPPAVEGETVPSTGGAEIELPPDLRQPPEESLDGG